MKGIHFQERIQTYLLANSSVLRKVETHRKLICPYVHFQMGNKQKKMGIVGYAPYKKGDIKIIYLRQLCCRQPQQYTQPCQ